jgi:hypothetical protein
MSFTLLPSLGGAVPTEENSKVGGQFMDVPHGDCSRLGRRCSVVWRRYGRQPQEFLKPGWREHEEIVVLNVAGIAQLMRDIARRHEAIARPEDEDLLSDSNLQLSDQDKIRFILARMRMPRHAHSGCETGFQKAICAAGVGARQTDGADTYIEIVTFGSLLMLD